MNYKVCVSTRSRPFWEQGEKHWRFYEQLCFFLTAHQRLQGGRVISAEEVAREIVLRLLQGRRAAQGKRHWRKVPLRLEWDNPFTVIPLP